jgi:hypothetical protein
LETGKETLFMRFLNFSDDLPVKPWIGVDFLQFSQGLPDPIKLCILFTTGPAAKKVISDLLLFSGLQFPVLVR